MKQLHKITFLIFINLLLFSCVDSEKDAISIQDLLLGKWQTTVYTENGIIPNNLNDCDLLRTMEFKNDVINYVEYKLDEESNCVFDKIDSYSYQITGSDSFDKIIVDDQLIHNKILKLTTTSLKVKYTFNDREITETFEKIN